MTQEISPRKSRRTGLPVIYKSYVYSGMISQDFFQSSSRVFERQYLFLGLGKSFLMKATELYFRPHIFSYAFYVRSATLILILRIIQNRTINVFLKQNINEEQNNSLSQIAFFIICNNLLQIITVIL